METEKLLISQQQYICNFCLYNTSRYQDYKRHITTLKHKNSEKKATLETLGNIKVAENTYNFYCEKCNYYCNKKSSYTKHLTTDKHTNNMTRVNDTTVEDNETNLLNCDVCNKEFVNRSGLWKHRKKCLQEQQNICKVIDKKPEEENKVSITNNIPMELILQVIKQSKEIQNVLIEQTKELQNKLLEKENQLLEQNAEHHKQLVELAKKPNMVNSNITNNQFNLNFFLNETCKNAMNIQDFIQSIKLTTQDFETTGRLGFVDGISRIFINELKRLEVERRPLHCTDVKRETVYIKDNDTWEKENQEKKKLKWAINSIAQLNLNQVQHWQQEYPECAENNTVANTKFNQMAMIALGGFGDEEEAKFRDKIMKNVMKEIVLTKDT
jgi:anion-transporting  ArsA/GET3 family ATPase